MTAAAGIAQIADGQPQDVPELIRNLKPMTGGIQPITDDERRGRMEKARKLMRDNHIGAIFLEGGSSLFYFTGTRWNATDRTFGLVFPAQGEPAWIVSAQDESKARAAIRLANDVRIWREEGNAYKLAVQFLKERGVTSGHMGIEERARFAIFDGLRKEAPALEFVSADPVTAACRVIKSPAELALMQRANEITIAAYRAAFATMKEGMTQRGHA